MSDTGVDHLRVTLYACLAVAINPVGFAGGTHGDVVLTAVLFVHNPPTLIQVSTI